MAGYVGYSRSWNSEIAIRNFEAPLSMIKRSYIDEYIDSSNFSAEEKTALRKTTVKNWKHALIHAGHSSWHHTSKFYNETYHYDLNSGAEVILSGVDYLPRKVENAKEYGCVIVQVWEGTRTRPRLVGTAVEYGTIKGDWLTNENGKRFKLSANKTLKVYKCGSLSEAKKIAKKKGLS